MLRLAFLLLFIFTGVVRAQQPVDIRRLHELQQKEKRMVMVLIGTDWCKFCGAMKNTIRTNEVLSAALSEKFYTVFLDAETKADIRLSGRIFSFRPNGIGTGIHELAEELGAVNGSLSLPTICFMDQSNKVIYRHAGFIPATSLIKLVSAISGR